jgi:hypothetical protein
LTDAASIGQLSGGHYYVAGGAGGGGDDPNGAGTGGLGGGGAGFSLNTGPYGAGPNPASNGQDNTGGGGGGARAFQISGIGGSGVVILKYPSTYTITLVGATLGTTVTSGAYKITSIINGSGTVSWL